MSRHRRGRRRGHKFGQTAPAHNCDDKSSEGQSQDTNSNDNNNTNTGS
jgi:hypothetical protein